MKTGRISTFSGTGEKTTAPDGSSVKGAALNGPRAIVFDAKGDMYLALREGNAVYRIDMTKLTLHHIAGTGEKGYEGDGGPAKQAKLSGPKGIDVSPDGGVLIADTESHTIRRIDLETGVITTVLGDGTRHDGPDGRSAAVRAGAAARRRCGRQRRDLRRRQREPPRADSRVGLRPLNPG